MDAVKFFEERNRMCRFYDDCNECPAKEKKCECYGVTTMNYDSIVHIVEEWSAANPRKTRQSVFLEQWPNVKMNAGVVSIAPCYLDRSKYQKTECTSADCNKCRREFWMQEVD